jgi:hypothetical protein
MQWKRLFVKAAGFGAGLALMLSVVAGGLLWYSNRPKPPKPWDNRAIVAEYDYITTEGDKNNIDVLYTLQNNTSYDYQVSSAVEVQLAGKLERENSLAIEKSEEGLVNADFPLFVPAHGRSRFGIHIAYPYSEKFDSQAPDDVRYDFGTRLAKFAASEFSNLDGFVLLDQSRRYRIELPSGWRVRAKEPLRIKREAEK